MSYSVRLAKDGFKFSATHFTVFDKTTAERLHGHNYQVTVECRFAEVGPLEMAFEFGALKAAVKRLSDQWDEKVLIPKRNPSLHIAELPDRKPKHWSVEFADRYYCFPDTDVAFIDATNITSEALARVFSERLVEQCPAVARHCQSVEIWIEETRGQAASFSKRLRPELAP